MSEELEELKRRIDRLEARLHELENRRIAHTDKHFKRLDRIKALVQINGKVTFSDLRADLRVPKPTLTALLKDILAEPGYRITHDPLDRRIKYLEFSEGIH